MNITSIWSRLSNFYSVWMVMILLLSIIVCIIATRPQVRDSVPGAALMIIGAPIFFITVLFSEWGMLIIKDGRDFGFPTLIRGACPNESDYLTTYIALGASYLLAREASRLPVRVIRIVGWIEAASFALLAAFEFFLLCRSLLQR
jgi:hypothetical protein